MSAAPNIPESLHSLNNTHPPTSNDYSNNHTNGLTTNTNGLDNHTNGHTNTTFPFRVSNIPVENFRPLKVIVIGAGYSGIYLAIRLPERLRNVQLTVYEKNAGVGGAWFENRYPGCACDIPAHSYQYSFNPNTNWSSLYAPAKEIQAYLEGTAKKYGAERFIKLNHKVEECRYDEAEAKWCVRVRNVVTGEVIHDTADILVAARGALNEPAWPDNIEGFGTFEGKVLHSAVWDESYDFRNKRVGVIGSGSSSIQIVPSLQKEPTTHITTFVRNKTWISPPFGQELWDEIGMKGTEFSPEQRAQFASDPSAYQSFRLRVEEGGNAIHAVTMRGTPMQEGGTKMFSKSMSERLASRPDIYEALLPTFAPGCRRLTPGAGYLEALCEPNVSFVNTPITRITPHGIETADGKLHALDVLACATGFKTGAPPPFPVIGRGGHSIETHWTKDDYPRSYMSLATDGGFPNYFMMLGPNSAIGSGSLTMMIESLGDYVTKCIRKIQKEDIRAMSVKEGAVGDFVEYAKSYFEGTVFTDQCRSWYKNRAGEVTGLWPGSTQHCIEVLRSPRWEDFEYEYVGEREGKRRNRLAWLGNGWTDNQMRERHLAWYLYPEFVDKPLEGRPEEREEYDVKPFSY